MNFQGIGAQGNYAAAGKAVANDATKTFAYARAKAPNAGEIALSAANLRSKEKQAMNDIRAEVASRAIQAKADITRKETITDASQARDKAKRKAGVLAAGGKFFAQSGALFDEASPKRQVGEMDSYYDKMAKDTVNRTEKWSKLLKSQKGIQPVELDEMPTAQNTGKADTNSSGGVNFSSGGTLTGNAKIVADAIAKYESGDWGYEAFNQGGTAGGTKVVGKSGSHQEHFGRSLTDLTLGEIFERQNTKERGMSMQQHLDSGGLHAVGRYQFIGSTLQNEVAKMGLSHDTKFSPEVQDKIWLSHIKSVGNISPWVGPSQNYSPAEKEQFRKMIQGF